MKLASLLAVSLAFLTFGGCSSQPKVDPQFDAEAKRFEPQPGKSNLYVVREKVLGSSTIVEVQVDDRTVGSLASGTFLLVSVAPGRHSVKPQSPDAQPVDALTIDAAAGGNCFVEVGVLKRVRSAQLLLGPLSDEKGRKMVLDCERAAPAPAPH